MKMFLDSANLNEIRHALDMWDIDGLTTNPRHVQSAGLPFLKTIEEIAKLFAGTKKPVSVEVNPHLTDWKAMVREGLELAGMSPNFVIKVGASEAGFRAIRELTAKNVRTNVTLIFSGAQAWHAARCGAMFVSPFLGWREMHGDSSTGLILEIAQMLNHGGYNTHILAAAIRNARQLGEVAAAGAHCVTAGLSVYQESFRNPYTTMGEKIFSDAWDATPKD